MKQIQNFVDGRHIDGHRTFNDIDPSTGIAIAQVHEADRAVVDAAVAAARAALDGPWGRTTVAERAALLRRIADLIDDRFDGPASPPRSPTPASRIALASSLDVAAGGRELPLVRRHRWPRQGIDSFLTDLPGRRQGAQLRGAQAARRGGRHRAVEPAAAAAHLEGCAGAGLRQRRGRQALARRPRRRRPCWPR